MKAIVYLSEATQPFAIEELDELSRVATIKNGRLGVTGYLSFQRNRFFQYVEGDPVGVEELMTSIRADPRHEITRSIEQPLPGPRRFPAWGMKHLDSDFLTEIGIEHVIEQQFICIENQLGDPERWTSLLWDSVQALARLSQT